MKEKIQIILLEPEAETRARIALLSLNRTKRLETATIMTRALSIDDEGFHPIKEENENEKGGEENG